MSIFLDQSQCHGVPQLQWPIFLLPYIHNSIMVKYVGVNVGGHIGLCWFSSLIDDRHDTTHEQINHIKYSLLIITSCVVLSLGLSRSRFKLFRLKCVGVHWALFHCPLYPGLTPSGALLTTAYWKFLRTDLHQGSCYEWVGFFCNPSSCDHPSCLSQSLSHVDESLPPTDGFLVRKHKKTVFFKPPTTPHWTYFNYPPLCWNSTSGAVLCSHGP